MLNLNTDIVKGTKDWDKPINENFKKLNNLISQSNPNLLVNGSFTIWQRGTKFENITRKIFTADRTFIGIRSKGKCSVTKLQGLTCGFIEDSDFIAEQSLSMEDIDLRGRDVTFSFLGMHPTEMTLSIYYSDGSGGWKKLASSTTTNNNLGSVTATIPLSAKLVNLELTANDLKSGDAVNMKYWKLELGDTATPIVPTSYTDEIYKCMRYYKSINMDGSCFLSDTESIAINLHDSIPMIKKPTVSFNKTAYLHTNSDDLPIELKDITWNGELGQTVFAVGIAGLKPNMVCTINASKEKNDNIAGEVRLILESEIL